MPAFAGMTHRLSNKYYLASSASSSSAAAAHASLSRRQRCGVHLRNDYGVLPRMKERELWRSMTRIRLAEEAVAALVETGEAGCPCHLYIGQEAIAVGMEAGDALLRGVAERLNQVIPNRALLARVGGDMFGVLLPEPLGADLQVLAERLLHDWPRR